MTKLPDTLQMRAGTLGTLVGAMWMVYVLDVVVPGAGSVAGHGIVPRTLFGLKGIPVAPLIHGSFQHLIANTIPFLILGGLVLLRGVLEFLFVVLTCVMISGGGTWMFGAGNAQHIGASGVVFGLFGYLLLRTVFDKRLSSAVITLIVAMAYGAAMLQSFIPTYGISWSGHFFGFLGGVVAARLRHDKSVTRTA